MAVRPLELAAERHPGGQGLWRQAARRMLNKKVAMAALSLIALFYLSGVFAGLLAPYGYNDQDLANALKGPSAAHWLGTDRLGRDVLSRVMWGLQTTVIITVTSILTGGLVLGIALGLLSGYFGKWVDAVIMRVGELFMAFPGMLLVILLAATLKPRVIEWVRHLEDVTGIEGIVRTGAVDYLVVFGALAAFGWVGMARVVRGQILSLKQNEFIEVSRAVGASPRRIILSHLLPNVLPPVIVLVSMGMGSVAGSEIVLSWLGIGIQPPRPSLGLMIYDNGSISALRATPHLLLVPVITIALLIYAWNLLGDALNDVLNPRAR